MPTRSQSRSQGAALITGAAHRIGRACALALAQDGISVVIHYHTSEKSAHALARTIRTKGGTAWTLQGNLANPSTATELFHEADTLTHGHVRILINSASMYEPSPLASVTLKEIQENLNLNALSPFQLAQAFAQRGKRGLIINMLDTRIVTLNNAYAAYHLSKSVLTSMTRMMAWEYAPRIRVNGIAPGVILPPPGKSRAYAATAAQANPMKRIGSPRDVVTAVRYLINAPFVTGQTLFVDGGYHLKGALHG
jgi:pteridine reductase